MDEKNKIISPLSTSGIGKFTSFVLHRLIESSVWTFAELGIADVFQQHKEPQTAKQLADAQGWNKECLYRILRAVTTAGILEEIQVDCADNNQNPEDIACFRLTDDGRLLTSDHPSKVRYLLRWELSPLLKATSNYLPKLVQHGFENGNGFNQLSGHKHIFEYLADETNKEMSQFFNEAMTSLSNFSAQAIVNAYNFSKFDVVVDIGGNLGTLLSHILYLHKEVKLGICFDLPHVIEQPTVHSEFQNKNISSSRYKLIAGDMFLADTIPQGDVYILQQIIHDWDDQHCIDILRAIHRSAKGNKITLLIIGFIILQSTNENLPTNWCAYAFDLHMMAAVSAKERTEAQHKFLLEKSGFIFKALHRTTASISIIEAVANQ